MKIILQFLSRPDGDKSSKRLSGTILILIGGFLALSTGICGIFFNVTDHEIIEYAIASSITGGSVLLGVGVLEKTIRGKNDKY